MRRYTGFYTILLRLTCFMEDANGEVYGSFEIDTKGVGGDKFSAGKNLTKELKKELPHKVKELLAAYRPM